MQTLFCLFTNTPQFSYREQRKYLLNILFPYHSEAIGLVHITRHLCKEFIRRYPNRGGKYELFSDAFLELPCYIQGVFTSFRNIHECLIKAKGFYERRIFS